MSLNTKIFENVQAYDNYQFGFNNGESRVSYLKLIIKVIKSFKNVF